MPAVSRLRRASTPYFPEPLVAWKVVMRMRRTGTRRVNTNKGRETMAAMQLGQAIRGAVSARLPLISGTMSGTLGSVRKAELRSMQRRAFIGGIHSKETAAGVQKKATSYGISR